jgi:glycosyltransferase involved in cell wall biosynthesis
MTSTVDHRIIFDITTSMRWLGPPTGIARVERQLALWALDNVPNIVFVFFDPQFLAYCTVLRDAREFLTGDAALDTLGLTNPALPGGRRTDRIPLWLRPLFLWITQSRRMMLRRLEATRLRSRSGRIAGLADWLQRRLMSSKHRQFMIREDNSRRPTYPYTMVVGPQIRFTSRDTLVCAGSGWGNTNIAAVKVAKSGCDFRMVLLCYDLIPLLFPRFYRNHDVTLFERYMRTALGSADCVVANSRAVARDIRQWSTEHAVSPGPIVVRPLGFDFLRDSFGLPAGLPAGLKTGHFVLFVSTIEPRKGHALLGRVWRRLFAEGVLQRADFTLVFAGRIGWMVDDLLLQLRRDRQLGVPILVLHEIDDSVLTSLYRAAAFCVYPSAYEGYGLPVVEAFAYGKAVITSTGGGLPELTQGLCPSIDADDEQNWYETMKSWIECPQLRVAYEQEVRLRSQNPTWSEAAEGFFATVEMVTGTERLGDVLCEAK